jgi:L-lactate dehydrogenase complex protein LldF
MEITIHDFGSAHREALKNESLGGAVRRATGRFIEQRNIVSAELDDWEALREYGAAVKDHTLAHLDHYLELLVSQIEARGGHVHFADHGADANAIISGICAAVNAKLIVKSKSMVTEEIELNEALEHAGMRVVETDLGEYILQQEGEAPSHIIGPAIHKPKSEVNALFHRIAGMPLDAGVDDLAGKAREIIRSDFLAADVGISGVNFAVAETGSIAIVENEGNARLTTSRPRVHIAVMGLEKVIPRISDLGVFLKLLPRSATGQRSSVFVSLISGPKRAAETDGPEEFHLVILDNGRSSILADAAMRESLRCIRCGACLNTCPVYKSVGGHAYGWVYSGPIGSVLDPALLGLKEAKALPFASSLCGACGDVCPVKIPLPQMLVTQRERTVAQKLNDPVEAAAMKGFAWLMTRPIAYSAASSLARIFPWGDTMPKMPVPPLSHWQATRDFPAPKKTFRQLWKEQK